MAMTEGERLAALTQSMSDLDRRFVRVEQQVTLMSSQTQSLSMDIHAAKVGGRWLLGVALVFGSVLGFFVKLWWERP
jgi:hypothetical protein